MAQPMTDQDRLAAAIAARHQLVTGVQAVEVDLPGYRARFTPANREALDSYITELQAGIAGKQTRGAIGVVF